MASAVEQRRAEACSEALHAEDSCSKGLDMQIIEVAPGRAVVEMVVREDMLNGHRTCHGGMIFTLADTTFGHACNGYNQRAVALSCNIDFVIPGHEGDRLRATCVERARGGRTGTYHCDVHNQDGKLVAVFQGRCYFINSVLVDEGEG